MAWIKLIGRSDADPALATIYEKMAARPMPPVSVASFQNTASRLRLVLTE